MLLVMSNTPTQERTVMATQPNPTSPRDPLSDPARDQALRFVEAWCARTGKDRHSADAEAIFEQAYLDAIISLDF